MAIDFRRPWSDEELELYRDTVVRFIETEVLPHDEQAREQGHVGHEVWRKAGALGLLCTDIPEEFGGAGGGISHPVDEVSDRMHLALTHDVASCKALASDTVFRVGDKAKVRRRLVSSRKRSDDMVEATNMYAFMYANQDSGGEAPGAFRRACGGCASLGQMSQGSGRSS